jgi:hypothetical protein
MSRAHRWIITTVLSLLAIMTLLLLCMFIFAISKVIGIADGGITGGIIAFFGAVIGGTLTLVGVRWTILNQENSENKKRTYSQLPILQRVLIELRMCNKSLEEMIKTLEASKNLEEQTKINGATEALKKSKQTIHTHNPENWDSINQIVDVDLMAELVIFKFDYTELSDALNSELGNPPKKNDAQGTVNYLMIENSKKKAWDLIINSSMKNRANKLMEQLEEELKEIKKN